MAGRYPSTSSGRVDQAAQGVRADQYSQEILIVLLVRDAEQIGPTASLAFRRGQSAARNTVAAPGPGTEVDPDPDPDPDLDLAQTVVELARIEAGLADSGHVPSASGLDSLPADLAAQLAWILGS